MNKPYQLIPSFVAQVMGDIPCIGGLFVAGVLSGALSSLSFGLSSLAAITFQDFIQAGCKIRIAENTKIRTTKALSLFCMGSYATELYT